MQFICSSCKVSPFQVFSSPLGMGPGSCNWENYRRSFGTVWENELDKLKKFTLNEHFIQTFVNYHPFSDIVLWNLSIAH